MMASRFFSVEDKSAKMHGSIVMHQGVPKIVVCNRDLRPHQVYTKRLDEYDPNQPITEITDYTQDDFDYNTVDLGYYYNERSQIVSHLCRKPGRYNNVGIIANNLDTALSGSNFYCKEMFNCIMGQHLDFKEARKKLWTSPLKRVPFHRHAAVSKTDQRNGTILYMNKPIAMIFKGSLEYVPFKLTNKDYTELLHKVGVS